MATRRGKQRYGDVERIIDPARSFDAERPTSRIASEEGAGRHRPTSGSEPVRYPDAGRR